MISASYNPVVLVTTVQPYLLLWVSAISFFAALSIVAIVSKGRKWHELLGLFGVVFPLLIVGGTAMSSWLLDVQIVQFELISMLNS